MSEKEWTIGNIIALADRFGVCIHRNLNAAYYHGEIDIREREKKEANENEIEARTELEQAVSSVLAERDALRAENEKLQKLADGLYLLLVDNPKSKRLADLIIKHVYSYYNTQALNEVRE